MEGKFSENIVAFTRIKFTRT